MLVYGIWTFCAAVAAFLISAVTGKFLIPYLRKLHFGQTILEEGPKWHSSKQGTPIMGGIMFIIAIVVVTTVSTLLYVFLGGNFIETYFSDISRDAAFLFAGLGLAVANGLIGFIDDYTKVVKKRNLGLTAIQKLVLQFLAAGIYLAVLGILGYGTSTVIPFVGTVDLGFFYYASKLYSLGITAASAAVAGACLGFLVWNFHPAKVFMGDTGSLFLGGIVCALAFAVNMPILLLPLGIVYLCEMFSVMLQVSYFKLSHGKRLFKMAPIHHHFEMCGWSEVKIVAVFSAVTALFGAGAFLLVLFGV